MRWVVVSVAVHAALLWLLWPPHRSVVTPRAVVDEPPTEVVLVEPPAVEETALAPGGGGGGGGAGGARGPEAHAPRGVPVHADAWDRVVIGTEVPTRNVSVDGSGTGNVDRTGAGTGSGSGNGNGNGNGIGFGNGGGIATQGTVPAPVAPPAPPPPSKARPAKLLQPARDREVEDEDDLFVARVTVDETGDVVAVRFVTTHPGLRGDQASSAIWSFRYSPALDDDGAPIRSTFEQPFQVR